MKLKIFFFNLKTCIDTYNFEISICYLMQKRLLSLTSTFVFKLVQAPKEHIPGDTWL